MDNRICKAKSIFDGKWVVGYYVAVPWEHDSEIVHLIISQKAEYRGCGEFGPWNVCRVDPNTVCRYTGKEDQHNEPVFENDFVYTEFGRSCLVVWFSSPQYCGWDLIPVANFDAPAPNKNTIWASRNLEVYGNKFD